MTLHKPRGSQPRDRSAQLPATVPISPIDAALTDTGASRRIGQSRRADNTNQVDEPSAQPPRPAPARPWMTPVDPATPQTANAPLTHSPSDAPAPPSSNATSAPIDQVLLSHPPDTPPGEGIEQDGEFTVGPDFRLRSLKRAAHCFLFPDDAAPNESIWVWLSGDTRRCLYGAFKRLLRGESRAFCESRDASGLTSRFECTRRGEEFVTRYSCSPASSATAIPPAVTAPGGADVERPALLGAAARGETQITFSSGSEPAVAKVPDDVFQFSPDIICILDNTGRVLRINPTGQRTLDFDTASVPGVSVLELVTPDDHDLLRRTWQQIISQPDQPLSVPCRCRGKDENLRWVEWNFAVVPADAASGATSEPQRVYATGRDVTEHRSREESMQWHLYHDALTGLPNRSLLQDRLQHAIAFAHRYKHNAAVLFLDLDRFKRVNDTLGHAAGDALLREVASRLTVGLREEDTVARLAGDEFIVVLPRVQDFRDAQHVAEKILARIGKPLQLGGQELFITGSIGISLYPQDGTTGDALLRAADTAMYRAKAGGPGRYSVSDTTLAPPPGRPQGEPMERLRLENKLSQAIERDELFLHYQPQVSLATGQIVGAEALMRWKSDGDLVPPSTFIPLAEETGLIVRLGTWAMHEAIVQAGAWRRAGHPVQVAVNLSAAQLSDRRFPEILAAYLRQFQIPASLLDLELTERTFINAESAMLDVLTQLKAMGIGLSVDDFGTGYGTFSYLRKFPIDGLKVDRSFTAHVDTNAADEAVVRSIIDLAHTLKLKVIAEGVETVGQRDKLLALGCDTMQGYLFSRAVAPGDLSPMLTPGKRT